MARPGQAALASAASFAAGASAPLIVATLAPPPTTVASVAAVTLLGWRCLALVEPSWGSSAVARGDEGHPLRALALDVTGGIGRLVGMAV